MSTGKVQCEEMEKNVSNVETKFTKIGIRLTCRVTDRNFCCTIITAPPWGKRLAYRYEIDAYDGVVSYYLFE